MNRSGVEEGDAVEFQRIWSFRRRSRTIVECRFNPPGISSNFRRLCDSCRSIGSARHRSRLLLISMERIHRDAGSRTKISTGHDAKVGGPMGRWIKAGCRSALCAFGGDWRHRRQGLRLAERTVHMGVASCNKRVDSTWSLILDRLVLASILFGS